MTDIEIIESIKRGNEADFSLLIDRYKDKAFSLLSRILKNEMDAEEVLQDCFLKAYSSLNNFRQDAKFSTWFYRIVYNTALTVVGAKKRQTEKQMSSIEDHYDLEDKDNKIYAETDNAKEYIMKMIDQLPIKSALVIILYYLDGLSLSEIGNVMGLSLVNTKVILHRSRNALKDLLLKHNYHEEML
ncbi:MAG: RNA polymerase sigma factor [Melioribacteraceae bacterium]|nr:RNA polymerase sigma factor [Melioribacteraceae bacterium]